MKKNPFFFSAFLYNFKWAFNHSDYTHLYLIHLNRFLLFLIINFNFTFSLGKFQLSASFNFEDISLKIPFIRLSRKIHQNHFPL